MTPGLIILTILAGLVFVVLVGPFMVPVPDLEGLSPVTELLDADSQFVQLNGLSVHYKKMGQGQPFFLLLHGFGASLYSWNPILEPLSQLGTVLAFDRPAFGLTERPLSWKGQNPYSPQAQVELVTGLLDHFGVQQAILVGNSAGGMLAMLSALQHPERVQALILVDPVVYSGGGAPKWVKPFFNTPQMRHLGPLVSRQLQARSIQFVKLAWHDPSMIKQETFDLYQKPLQVENWDHALWELTLASRTPDLINHLNEFTLPVLVVTGDDDRIVPTSDSIRLAGEIPNARLEVIHNAGHVPHEERPEAFMEAVQKFVTTLNPSTLPGAIFSPRADHS